MADLQGFVEPARAVLRMEGADARSVLQGVVTNDVNRLAPGRAVYAALLTPQGKYLFDFFLLDTGDGAVLVDTLADQAEGLAQRLKMYCLRRDARIVAQADMAVAMVWPSALAGAGDPAFPPEILAVRDPRAAALGWRLYGPADALQSAIALTAPRAAYDALRVAHLVPESGVELLPNETYILEAGFERLDGVDFRKGCYVGQEVTARMKHKTELRKLLVGVSVEGDAPEGTPITASGKPAGTLFTVSGGRGMAHLRLDRAGPGMEAGGARVDYAG